MCAMWAGSSRTRAGAELSDLEAARDCALRFARQVLADKLVRGEIIDGTAFEISDKAGTVLTTVPFRDAIRLE
jgi:hypothetical protein